MNRRYTVKTYVDVINRAVAKIQLLGLGTDLMVGFPGETDTAFQNTLTVARDLPFSSIHVFPYSARPGTAAVRIKKAVPALTVGARADLLQHVSRVKKLSFHHQQIGATVPVLFESGTQDGYRHGTTPNFTKVAVAGSDDLRNQIKPVTLTAAGERWAFGHLELGRPAITSLIRL